MFPQRHPLTRPSARPPAVSTLSLETDDCVYRFGDAATGLFRIRSGRVRLIVPHEGRERLVALLGPGDLFGDAASTGSRSDRRSETARCELPTVLAPLGSDTNSALSEAPVPAELFEALLADRRARSRRLRILCFEKVENRLAAVLADLSSRLGEPCRHGAAGRDLACVTQEDLADLVGSSRAFVSTTLNRLKRDGALAAIGRVLCLHRLMSGMEGPVWAEGAGT